MPTVTELILVRVIFYAKAGNYILASNYSEAA